MKKSPKYKQMDARFNELKYAEEKGKQVTSHALVTKEDKPKPENKPKQASQLPDDEKKSPGGTQAAAAPPNGTEGRQTVRDHLHGRPRGRCGHIREIGQ